MALELIWERMELRFQVDRASELPSQERFTGDPEILILDEATASLDPVSEVYVQRTLRNFADEAKTIIFITHRLAAVKDFDLLFVLAQGKVAEQGTPKELLDMGGKYYHMINKQFILSH